MYVGQQRTEPMVEVERDRREGGEWRQGGGGGWRGRKQHRITAFAPGPDFT